MSTLIYCSNQDVNVELLELKGVTSYILYVSLLARVEVLVDFVEDMHSQDSPIVSKARCCIDPFITIQRSLSKDLEVRHLYLGEKKVRVVFKLAAESKSRFICISEIIYRSDSAVLFFPLL